VLDTINYTCGQLMEAENAIDMFIEKYQMKPLDALNWFYMTEWNTTIDIPIKMLFKHLSIAAF